MSNNQTHPHRPIFKTIWCAKFTYRRGKSGQFTITIHIGKPCPHRGVPVCQGAIPSQLFVILPVKDGGYPERSEEFHGGEEGKLEGAASQKYPICIKIIGVNKTGN